MGFYATASECECRAKTRASAAKPSGEDVPPSKNRVWDFSKPSPICARQSVSQVLDLHRGKQPKPTIIVSGVRYYGYRYLHPELGCWMSRDPIGDIGFIRTHGFSFDSLDSLAAYGFLDNAPIGSVDLLGLVPKWWPWREKTDQERLCELQEDLMSLAECGAAGKILLQKGKLYRLYTKYRDVAGAAEIIKNWEKASNKGDFDCWALGAVELLGRSPCHSSAANSIRHTKGYRDATKRCKEGDECPPKEDEKKCPAWLKALDKK